MIQIDLQNLFDREADPFSISNQSSQKALNPKPTDRGHEPDPNMDPRVEDQKDVRFLLIGLCSRQMSCEKHMQKLFKQTMTMRIQS